MKVHIHMQINCFYYLLNDIDQNEVLLYQNLPDLIKGHPFKCVFEANLATKIFVNIWVIISVSA